MAKVKEFNSGEGTGAGLGGPFNPRPKGLEHLSEAQCWELVERFQTRRAREEEERRNPRRDPEAQARIQALWPALLADIEALPKPKHAPTYRPPARRIEDIEADYAANPVKLSPELVERLRYLEP